MSRLLPASTLRRPAWPFARPASDASASASASASTAAARPGGLARSTRRLLWAGMLLHLLLAAGVGLSPDEAHYALYGAHPAWSYFDHPPLVGWLQWLFVQAGGSDLALRVLPMAAWLLACLAAIGLGRELPPAAAAGSAGDARDASTARDDRIVALMLASPLLDLLGVALVPDTLLLPLVPCAMRLAWRLRAPGPGRLRDWVALGAVGGACLLAKYTGALVVLGALATLLHAHGRRLPAMRGAWVTAALVMLGALPVIGWNAAHGWLSIRYQAGHVAGTHAWSLVPVLRTALVQVAAYGPLLALAAWRAGAGPAAAAAVGGRPEAPADRDLRDLRWMTAAFALPVIAIALAASGRGTALPHWTACGWMALVPLAASGPAWAGAWARRTLAAQGLAIAALLAVVMIGGVGDGRPDARGRTAPNPAADLYGWRDAAREATRLARAHGADTLAVGNWSLASRLAWYGRPMPVRVVPSHHDQFDLWFGPMRTGESALLVDWSGLREPLPVGPAAFRRCTPVGASPALRLGRPVSRFDFLLCEGWQGAGSAPPDGGERPPR